MSLSRLQRRRFQRAIACFPSRPTLRGETWRDRFSQAHPYIIVYI